MALQRWDLFREMVALREAFDRLFERSFAPGGLRGGLGEELPMDVAETPEAVIIKASLPGVKPEDIDVSVQGDRLMIRGEARAEEERQDRNWLVREQHYGTYQRTLLLP